MSDSSNKKNGDRPAAAVLSDRLRKTGFKVFKGLDGIPFRLYDDQEMPHIKEDDPQHVRPVEVMDAKVRVFDLSKPKDLEDYTAVIDEVAKGHVLISQEQINWSKEKETYIVLLRWLELFLEQPQGGMRYE